MKKNMYSLILMDEVVQEVDRVAYERGMSRSALINQVLAEYVSLMTPQKRIEQIFGSIASVALADSSLQVQATTPSILSLRSVLNYKYNPTIRYNVEINLENGGYVCKFKAVSRTQSPSLKSRLSIFYELWTQIEQNYLAGKTNAQLRYAISGAHFHRTLHVESDGEMHDTEVLGDAIGKYVRLFDDALKVYFEAQFGVDMKTFESMQRMYSSYMETAEIFI